MNSIHTLLKLIPLMVGILFLAAVGLIAFARVERTIEAPGEVRVERYEVLRSKVAGLVREVLVEPGDQVERGQAIMQLQNYQLVTDIAVAKRNLEEALAERRGVERDLQLLESRVHPLEVSRQKSEVQRESLEADLRRARVRELQLQLESARRAHDRVEELAQEGLVSEERLEEARLDKEEARQRLAQGRIEADLAEASRAVLKEDLALLEGKQHRTRSELQARLQSLAPRIARLREKLHRLEEQRDMHEIRAGMDGVVVGEPIGDLLGRRVEAGDELGMVIDPHSVDFIARVPERALVRVRRDQSANIEIRGLPKRRFDLFHGRVLEVSQQPDLDNSGGRRLYPVEVHLESPWLDLKRGDRFYLRSGMQGKAEIAYHRDVAVVDAILDVLVGTSEVEARDRGTGS